MLPRLPVSALPPGAPRPFQDELLGAEAADDDVGRARKQWYRGRLKSEMQHSANNMVKIQESYVKIMRGQKTKTLKVEVDVVSQNHERDVDRKDAVLQMIDRDLDEAEEQHHLATRTHLQNMDQLVDAQKVRCEALHAEFEQKVRAMEQDFSTEQARMEARHALEKGQLECLVEQIGGSEEARERAENEQFQAHLEMIRNRHIEEDHQMRSVLEENVEAKRGRCSAQLTSYRTQTEASTQDYHAFLERDAKSSREVEQRLRQVERMQANIQHWRAKIVQTKNECEERNAQLKGEKEVLHRHFRELKGRMDRFRKEQRRRLVDLTVNARSCEQNVKGQLQVAERILTVAEACRKYETEHEKTMPYYLDRTVDVDTIPFEDEDVKEEIRDCLADTSIDEWTYLNMFMKRYNKAQLDHLAVEKEKSHLEKENGQLRTLLKQIIDGVSVNAGIMEAENPLLVVNGQSSITKMPVVRKPASMVTVEAAHLVAAQQRTLVRA